MHTALDRIAFQLCHHLLLKLQRDTPENSQVLPGWLAQLNNKTVQT